MLKYLAILALIIPVLGCNTTGSGSGSDDSGTITITVTCPNIITSKQDPIVCSIENPDTVIGVKKMTFSVELTGSVEIGEVILGGEIASRRDDGSYIFQSSESFIDAEIGSIALTALRLETSTLTLQVSEVVTGDDMQYSADKISTDIATIYLRPACDEVVAPEQNTLCIDHDLTPDGQSSLSTAVHLIVSEDEPYISAIEMRIISASENITLYDFIQPTTNDAAPNHTFASNSSGGVVIYSPQNESITSDGDLVAFDVGAVSDASGSYLINIEDAVAADDTGSEVDIEVYPGQVTVP